MKTINDPSYLRFLIKLRDARIAAHISQEELARRLRKHQTFVSKIETAQRTLDLLDFLIWAREIGSEPKGLLEDFIEEVQHRKPRIRKVARE